MRVLTVVAFIVAVVVIGFGVKTIFIASSTADAESIVRSMETSTTLSPYELHINYPNTKDLIVHEIKDPV